MNILELAISALQSANKVNIKGKQYSTVATRIEIFRRFFGADYSITTDLVENSSNVVFKATISNLGQVVATGWAQEKYGDGHINRTACMENAETSAIGRALANFGLHGGEYASVNEIEKAVAQEERGGGLKIGDLKEKSRHMRSELESCQDIDQLNALMATKEYQSFVDDMKKLKPQWYDDPKPHDGELWLDLERRIQGELIDQEERKAA